VVHAIEKGEFDAIIMNYANADMVGHSGKLEAAIKAVEAVDSGSRASINIAATRRGLDYHADHGNAETMIDPKRAARTPITPPILFHSSWLPMTIKCVWSPTVRSATSRRRCSASSASRNRKT